MYDLPPRRRISLILVKLGPAHQSHAEVSEQTWPDTARGSALGLYRILPSPILHGMYCNKGWSGGNTASHNSVSDEGGEWGAQTKGVFGSNSIDSCAKASN